MISASECREILSGNQKIQYVLNEVDSKIRHAVKLGQTFTDYNLQFIDASGIDYIVSYLLWELEQSGYTVKREEAWLTISWCPIHLVEHGIGKDS